MKRPTQEQIDRWLNACAHAARGSLPYDHPRRMIPGGFVLKEAQKAARSATTNLHLHGLYDAEEIRRRAWGDVDLDALRAERARQDEERRLRGALRDAAEKASVEQLRAALAALGVSA